MMSKIFLSLTSVFFLSSSLSATDIEPPVVDGDEVQMFQPLQSRRSFRANDHAYVLRVENLVRENDDSQDDTANDADSAFLQNLKSFQLKKYGERSHYWTAILVEVREALRKEFWPFEATAEHPTVEVGSCVRILMSDDLKIGDRISCKEIFGFSTPGGADQSQQSIYFASNLHPLLTHNEH